MLNLFGQWSDKIARIALAFPSTLYRRDQYLKTLLVVPSVYKYVVCPTCLSLSKFEHCLEKRGPQIHIKSCHHCLLKNKVPSVYKYVVCPTCLSLSKFEHCLEKRGPQIHIKSCHHCLLKNKLVPLLKEIITSSGSKKYYPKVVFPSVSLISSLQSLLSRPGFYNQCELWHHNFEPSCSSLSDVYCGKLWKDFLCFDGKSFLEAHNNLGFMMNVDWFQPYKHRTYSLGVIYLAIMNLPRSVRFKRDNIIVVGLIPGPSEPP